MNPHITLICLGIYGAGILTGSHALEWEVMHLPRGPRHHRVAGTILVTVSLLGLAWLTVYP